MADLTIYELGVAGSRSGAIFWVQIPSGAPSGYDDLQIGPDIFLAPEQADILANENAIAILEVDVAELQASSSKRYDQNRNADYDYTQLAGSLIREMYFTVISGTPTVSVGTTPSGTDIMSSRLIEGGFRSDSSINEFTSVSRSIYITVSGGIVDVVTYTKLNLNS